MASNERINLDTTACSMYIFTIRKDAKILLVEKVPNLNTTNVMIPFNLINTYIQLRVIMYYGGKNLNVKNGHL